MLVMVLSAVGDGGDGDDGGDGGGDGDGGGADDGGDCVAMYMIVTTWHGLEN